MRKQGRSESLRPCRGWRIRRFEQGHRAIDVNIGTIARIDADVSSRVFPDKREDTSDTGVNFVLLNLEGNPGFELGQELDGKIVWFYMD